jgi:hypothetical protein
VSGFEIFITVNVALADIALALLLVLVNVGVVQGRWLKRVIPAWLFHIDCLLRGQDPPGDAPVPELPPISDSIFCGRDATGTGSICRFVLPPPLPLPKTLTATGANPTLLTDEMVRHGVRKGDPIPEPPKKQPCRGFRWIGQSFTHCDGCGLPFWEHTHDTVLKPGADPFDDDPFDFVPISHEQAARVKARWSHE